MILKRREEGMGGVFSELCDDETGNVVFHTGEHAYLVNGKWQPKIPNGVWVCKRGTHRLHWSPEKKLDPQLEKYGVKIVEDGTLIEFETFEITGVPGHQNLLFHWGNFPQRDSDGCILVGDQMVEAMVTHSIFSFVRMMALLGGIDEFNLTVV